MIGGSEFQKGINPSASARPPIVESRSVCALELLDASVTLAATAALTAESETLAAAVTAVNPIRQPLDWITKAAE
jgi:hypothetical protein